ncbi:MAG: hypothetical protein ACRD3I_06410 [Terriglobales bacterium]
MATHHSRHESLVLEILRDGKVLTLEEVSMRIPQLQGGEIFHAVDALSRRGDIVLRRHGFEYELQLGGLARHAPGTRSELSGN